MAKRDRMRRDHRRTVIAQEAARIMQEHGLTDFRSAKEKAMLRLGLQDHGALPSNAEVDQALTERNRIFRGDGHTRVMNGMRHAALALMGQLSRFRPKLAGAVLKGNATEHATIEIHLFNDAAEDVSHALRALGIAHRAVEYRMRIRADEAEQFPGYRVQQDGLEFALTVFPERVRGHAPLSPVDGRPMRRAGIRELEAMLKTET